MEPSDYAVSGKRWFVLAIYSCLSIANAALWVTYAPISDITQAYFGGADTVAGSLTAVNMLATSYQIFYIPGTFLAAQMMKMYGLRTTVLLSGGITAVGALLRLVGGLLKDGDLIDDGGNYAFQLLGQSLAAIAQPLLLNLVAAIASIWFPLRERDTATTVATLFNPIGSAVGQVIPAMLVWQSDDGDDDGDGTVHGMVTLLLVEFILCVVPVVIAYIWFDNNPATPPSRSTHLKSAKLSGKSYSHGESGLNDRLLTVERDDESQSNQQDAVPTDDDANPDTPASAISAYNANVAVTGGSSFTTQSTSQKQALTDASSKLEQELRRMFTDRDYILLFTCFSFGVGLFNALVTLLNQILDAQGYSNSDAGNFGAVLIVSGLVGAAVFGYLMEKTRAYRTLLKACFGLLIVSFIFVLFMLTPDNSILLLLSFAVLGFFLLALLPVAIENAAEVVYPVDEEVSVGALFLGGNIVGIGFVFIIQGLLTSVDPSLENKRPFLPSNMFMLGFVCLCGVLVMMYNGQYHRLRHDASEQPHH